MAGGNDYLWDNLKYSQEKDGIYLLLHLGKNTNIMVQRSHEGYSHFAQWFLKYNGKIKKSYEIKEKNEALQAGYFLFIELVTEKMLKKKGM